MSDSLTLTFKLSPEAREFVRQRVERGEYTSEEDLVSQSVESMMDDAEQLEQWLREPSEHEAGTWMDEVIGPIYDRLKADPGSAIPSEQVQQYLEARRRLRKMSA